MANPKIGLIGAGNIANIIAKHFKISFVFDTDAEGATTFSNKFNCKSCSFEDLIKSDCNLIIEAASQDAVKSYASDIIKGKKNLLIMSVGAFSDSKLLEDIAREAEANHVNILIPSGAIAGIDGLNSASMGEIESVVLTTRKNSKSLGFDEEFDSEKVVFEGFAKEAVEKFPKNINVAATLSLAGIGFEKTKVIIIADPKVKENIHEILVKGEFGEFKTVTKNMPSSENPSTSYLAAMSAVATIKSFFKRVKVGT